MFDPFGEGCVMDYTASYQDGRWDEDGWEDDAKTDKPVVKIAKSKKRRERPRKSKKPATMGHIGQRRNRRFMNN